MPQSGAGPLDAASPPPVAQPDASPSVGAPAQVQPLPVALLLPPRSGDFGRAAAALRAGFEAARDADADPVAVEVVESGDGKAALSARYAELAARGVGVVVGPLTRSGVNALADLGRPPLATLTLNQPDAGRVLPDNALAFGLPIEDEVRQLARLAYADVEAKPDRAGRAAPRALVISASSPLARRAAAAAYDAWREQGGTAELPAEFEARAATDLRDQLAALQADAVVVTGPADLVRVVRAALAADGVDAPSTPVIYATSLMTAGGAPDRRLPDVDGVRMVEMPWFAAAQRDDIKALPRPRGAMANVELQRLYALGIDAYRVAAELARGRTGIALDGATGRLSRDAGGARLERAGLACEWRNGMLVPMDGR